MKPPRTGGKPPRIRLSLETTPSDKQTIIDHGALCGTKSLIGSIRIAVKRSTAVLKLKRRGTLWLARKDGAWEEIDL